MPQVTFIICSIFPSTKHRIVFYLQKKIPIFLHMCNFCGKFAINCEKSCTIAKFTLKICFNQIFCVPLQQNPK